MKLERMPFMGRQIITYPQSIRDLCGIDTVIFTYSTDVAYKLRQLIGSEYQVIFHSLDIEDDEELEWVQDALYHSHIFIVTESETPFNCGYALAYAINQHPELVIGYGASDAISDFISLIIKDRLNEFTDINELADFIKDQ